MENLSNTAIIGTFISLLLTALSVIWGLYKNSENQRNKERLESMRQIIQQGVDYEAKQTSALQKQIDYQQELLENYKTDLNELQDKYFELGSQLHPALTMTNKTLKDIGAIIMKLIENGKNERENES